MSKIFEKLRNFDAYPKIKEEDALIQTLGGAAISVISVIIMLLLFFIELMDYMQPNVVEELFVDTSRSPNIQINLDIIVPQVSCDYLVLDAMDSSGEQHLEITHNIFKRRLDLSGQPIEEAKKEDIKIQNDPIKNETEISTANCGSCYGAALDPNKCCNTCEDVRAAYRMRQWAFPLNPENITQCKNEKVDEKLKMAFKQGCQIYGTLVVNRVSGSFHVAPGKSFSINHVHVHDVQPFSSNDFNTSHQIKHLSFGERIQSAGHNPLDETVGTTEEGATMFQYYIKIVPTQYVSNGGVVINTNQFSVTKHKKVISITSGESGMPGIFFQYELAPLMVKYTEKSRSLGHFLTNVCAIIGGVFTVAGLLDSFFFHTTRLIQKKFELGKLH